MKVPKLNYDGFDIGTIMSMGTNLDSELNLFTIMSKNINEMTTPIQRLNGPIEYVWECRIQIEINTLGSEDVKDANWHITQLHGNVLVSGTHYIIVAADFHNDGTSKIDLIPTMINPYVYGN